jgi:hypothetical protein
MVPGATPGNSERRGMPTEYVRGYQDQSGGSHMFALWTQTGEPDETCKSGWVWVRADKVLWVARDLAARPVRTLIVFDGGNSLTTDAEPEDVRWGIDLALNGGVHRTKPMLNLESKATREAYEDAQLAGFLAAQAAFKRDRDGQ